MKLLKFSAAKAGSILLISLICTLSGCTGGIQKHDSGNDLKRMNLKGKVSSVTETIFNCLDEKGEIKKGDIISKETWQFNEKGNTFEYKHYSRDGSIMEDRTYKYDYKGRLIERKDLDHNGNLEYSENYSYDKRGYETERVTYRPADNQWSISVYRDPRGNVRKQSYHSLLSDQKLNIRYTNDEKGNKIEEKNYGSGEKLVSRRVNKFDEKGNITETRFFNSSDSLVRKESYEYSESGHLLGYNFDISPLLKESRSFKYDERGNISEVRNAYPGQTITERYTYGQLDKPGNWHFRSMADVGEDEKVHFLIITEREIQYY